MYNLKTPDVSVNIPDETVLLAYRGSIAHNMYVPNTDPNSIDDVDLMGIVIAPIENYFGLSEWGSRGTKDYWEGHYDVVLYEIRKAVSLLLQGNPNILSLLWLRPEHYILKATPLVENRNLFVGKHVYNAFAGYAYAQLQKMETRDPAELRLYIAVTNEMKARGIHPNHKGEKIPYPAGYDASHGEAQDVSAWGDEVLRGKLASFQKKGENLGYMGDKRKQLVLEHGYDAKNAAHCIRLLRMCVEFLGSGEMQVYRTTDAAELLDIKRGKWPLSQVKELAESMFADAKAARDKSPLPEGPDREKAEKLLVNTLTSWHF